MYREQNQCEFARTLGNQSTSAEKHLWRFLRARQLRGDKFRRQTGGDTWTVVDRIALVIEELEPAMASRLMESSWTDRKLFVLTGETKEITRWTQIPVW